MSSFQEAEPNEFLPKQYKYNPLLVKSDVGHGKPLRFHLPGEEHVYGKVEQREYDGAKKTLQGWRQHIHTRRSDPDKDFLTLNRNAINAGAVSSHDVSEYQRSHDVRIKMGRLRLKRADCVDTIHDRPAGAKSSIRPCTPINKVISGVYQHEWVAQRRILAKGQKNTLSTSKKERQEASHGIQTTKSSRSRAKAASLRQEELDKAAQRFTLKKFQNVESRVQIGRLTARKDA